MLRQITIICIFLLTAGASAFSAIWPEEFFTYKRVSVEASSPGDEPIWEEFGFEEGEIARYELDGSEFQAIAWRFNDATSAMAVYEWNRPLDVQPAELTALSVQWDDGVYLAHGNYVLRFDGFKPNEEQVVGMLLIVPMLEQSPLPTWVSFLPATEVVPGTQRFVIGPSSLEEFAPEIPPSVVGFHFGAEGRVAEYQSPEGNLKLGVFSYPTPHIARDRLTEFRMLPDTVVKRSGPLLAVVLDPPNADEAEKLLGRVNYRGTITWDQISVPYEPSLAELVLTTFLFLGGLFLAALILGAVFGGFRFRNWGGRGVEEETMTMLHIRDK